MFWVRVQGIYGNSLNCLFNYSVNLKLLLKKQKMMLLDCFMVFKISLRKKKHAKNTHTH